VHAVLTLFDGAAALVAALLSFSLSLQVERMAVWNAPHGVTFKLVIAEHPTRPAQVRT